MQPVAGASKHTFNLAGYYETKMFSARLAYNYRSRFVFTFARVSNPGLPDGSGLGIVSPVMEDGRGILDFSASVTPAAEHHDRAQHAQRAGVAAEVGSRL